MEQVQLLEIWVGRRGDPSSVGKSRRVTQVDFWAEAVCRGCKWVKER